MRSASIRIEHADPLDQNAEGLIHPTTGDRALEGDRLDTFYQRTGGNVRDAVGEAQPIRIGEVLETCGGKLSFRRIIHAPVQTAPGVPTTLKNVQTGLRSALVSIDTDGIRCVVCPRPFPDELDDASPRDVARCLLEDLAQYPPVHIEEIRLVDRDPEWIRVLRSLHSPGDREPRTGIVRSILNTLKPW